MKTLYFQSHASFFIKRSLPLVATAVVLFAFTAINAQQDALARQEVPPIKIDASARTFKDVEKEQFAWYGRVLVVPALKRIVARKDAPSWGADACNFLKNAPTAVFAEQAHPSPTALQLQAHRLVDAGCDDYAVLLLAGMVDVCCGTDWRFVWHCSTRALNGLDADEDLPTIFSFHANGLLAWAYSKSGNDKGRADAEAKRFEACVRMAHDGSFKPDETELFLRHYLMSETRIRSKANTIRELAPKLPLPAWAQQTLLGWAEVELAWGERGSGWASSVTEAKAERFDQHLIKARTAFVQAWKANPKCPLAATGMIGVAMAGQAEQGESVRLWFDRATAAQCDYWRAYESIQWAYRPRWGGSHDLMLAFGRACLDTKRYDLDIPIKFAYICNDIVAETSDWRAFYRQPEVAKPLMELGEGLLREPTRAAEHKERLSYLAVYAWLTGDNARAAALLAELGGPLHPYAARKLTNHRSTESEMRNEVVAGNSGFADHVARANALYESGNLAEAGDLLRKIEASAPDTAGVREQLVLVNIEQRLSKGEWVQLPVNAALSGWLQRGGDWSGTADGVLINRGNDGKGGIIHRARVGPEFEMEINFSVEAKENCCLRCDILFGWHSGFQEPYNSAIYGQGGKYPPEAKFGANYTTLEEKVKKGIPLKKLNVLFLNSSGGKLTFTVNGKQAFIDYAPANLDFGPLDGRVGVGSTRWCRLNVTHISKINVRRLGIAPPASEPEKQERASL